jgi:hypothetical protein
VIDRLLNEARSFVPVPITFRSGCDVYASGADEQTTCVVGIVLYWLDMEGHEGVAHNKT